MLRRFAWLGGIALLTGAAVVAACGDNGKKEDSPGNVINRKKDGGDDTPDPPDGAAACPAGCNYQTQSSCATNQTCGPKLVGDRIEPACEAAGQIPEGAACTDWYDCAPGLFCAAGACRKFCCGGDWSACPAGQSCFRPLFIRNPATDAGVPSGAELCFPVDNCDPLDPNACAEQPGSACQVVDPIGHVACLTEGSRKLGEDCSKSARCARGLLCVGGVCEKLCRTGAGASGSGCGAGENCVHFGRDPAGAGECVRQ
jgi:hypothetical protein